jgi:hypothetical protein
MRGSGVVHVWHAAPVEETSQDWLCCGERKGEVFILQHLLLLVHMHPDGLAKMVPSWAG